MSPERVAVGLKKVGDALLFSFIFFFIFSFFAEEGISVFILFSIHLIFMIFFLFFFSCELWPVPSPGVKRRNSVKEKKESKTR